MPVSAVPFTTLMQPHVALAGTYLCALRPGVCGFQCCSASARCVSLSMLVLVVPFTPLIQPHVALEGTYLYALRPWCSWFPVSLC